MPDHDDPFNQTRRDRLRPRPGGGRRALGRRAAPAAAAGAVAERRRSRFPTPRASHARRRAESARAGGQPAAAARRSAARLASRRWTSRGCGSTRSTRFAGSKSSARAAGVPNEIVLAARYVLCAALDEAVLSTPWGAQSEWAQHPLLVALHREAWGGEKFFEMLDRISADPGPLHRSDGAAVSRARLRLRRQVPGAGPRPRAARRDSAGPLSEDPQPSRHAAAGAVAALARPRGSAQSAHPLRAVVGGRRRGARGPRDCLHAVYYASLANLASPGPCRAGEDRAARTSPPPVAAPVAGPTLKQLLAPEEASGTMRVDEQGGRTR